jgi:hypothetical protein
MSLSPGTSFGVYSVASRLGVGGMGEVYRARDGRLDRDVAIKVLPESFAADAERVARFTREAKTLAALNHPNIAAIYGIEEQGDTRALVMELVEGEDLSQLIAGRPPPLAETLAIARQIADALEAAHEQGIVHRDLKPANVKVRPDGTVKVLDFGLAKAADASGADLTASPTLTAHATQRGTILGTAAYMAPEQARGKAVDKRADVWAFGVVLFEMLTGRQAFTGETVTDIIAAVVTRDPDWAALPSATPAPVRELLSRCLDKDPRQRLRDIGDARFALDAGRTMSGPSIASSGIALPTPAAGSRPWGWIAAAATLSLATAVLGVTAWRQSRAIPSADTFELAVPPPPGAEFQIGPNSGNVIVSPDGTKIAFVATKSGASGLWIRSLAADDARPLSGTEGASYPFWAPDSRRLGFFTHGKLRTVEISGGLPEPVADAPFGRGGTWTDDGWILFTPDGGGTVHEVKATGGPVKNLTTLDASREEDAHYWPVAIPGGARFLYFARSARPEMSGIYLARRDGSTPAIRLVASLSSGVPATSPTTGRTYLLWAQGEDLLVQPFDETSGALTGEARTIASGVRVDESQRQMMASVSSTGVLAWATARAADTVFSLFARDGRRIRQLDIPPGAIVQPTLSPDGGQLLFTRIDKGQGAIYLHDLRTGATHQVTSEAGFTEMPSWTPDGRGLTFDTTVEGHRALKALSLETGAQSTELARDALGLGQETPDARYVVYAAQTSTTGLDVMARPVAGGHEPVALVATSGDDFNSALSRDGRWLAVLQMGPPVTLTIARLAYQDGVPSVSGTFPVERDVNFGVAFRGDGRELYYGAGGDMKSLTIGQEGDRVILGSPTVLFTLPTGAAAFGVGFAVSPDGQQFVIPESPFAAGQSLRVLTNWEARLTR